MLNAFYEGVKRAQPNARVISAGTSPYGQPPGGFSMRPIAFLRELFCLNSRLNPTKCPAIPRLDVLAHHPITTSGGPRRSAIHPDDAAMPDFNRIRRVLRAAERAGRVRPRGRHPLWATEFWWVTDPPSVTRSAARNAGTMDRGGPLSALEAEGQCGDQRSDPRRPVRPGGPVWKSSSRGSSSSTASRSPRRAASGSRSSPSAAHRNASLRGVRRRSRGWSESKWSEAGVGERWEASPSTWARCSRNGFDCEAPTGCARRRRRAEPGLASGAVAPTLRIRPSRARAARCGGSCRSGSWEARRRTRSVAGRRTPRGFGGLTP